MYRALLLLAAGCGRFGFGDGVDGGAGDAPDVPAGFTCDVTRVSSLPNTGETEIVVTAIPEGYIVTWVRRDGSGLRLQHFDPMFQPIEAIPYQFPLASKRIASVYTDRYLLAMQSETGTTATVYADDLATPDLDLNGRATLADPPGENGFVVRAGDLVMVSPHQGGTTMYTMSKDGSGAVNAGMGGSVGESVTDCTSDADDVTTVAACVMPTLADCPLTIITNATLVASYTSILQRCPSPSVARHAGETYIVFDGPGELRMASSRYASGLTGGAVMLESPGDHGMLAVDDRGLVLAYRDGVQVATAGFSLADVSSTRPPSTIAGMPAALGMALVPQGDHTILLVAADDGMYRVCI